MNQPRLQNMLLLAVLAGLSACSPQGKEGFDKNVDAAGNNLQQMGANLAGVANNFANQARDNAYKTSYQIQEWAMKEPEPPKGPSPVDSRYCYQSFHDILCYRAPMPGAEHRLVSYQGTFAEPPPQPTMKLLPTHPYDPSQMPERRVAVARPVFIGLPPEVKPDTTPQAAPTPEEIKPENIPEQLPNPALVPQL